MSDDPTAREILAVLDELERTLNVIRARAESAAFAAAQRDEIMRESAKLRRTLRECERVLREREASGEDLGLPPARVFKALEYAEQARLARRRAR